MGGEEDGQHIEEEGQTHKPSDEPDEQTRNTTDEADMQPAPKDEFPEETNCKDWCNHEETPWAKKCEAKGCGGCRKCRKLLKKQDGEKPAKPDKGGWEEDNITAGGEDKEAVSDKDKEQ